MVELAKSEQISPYAMKVTRVTFVVPHPGFPTSVNVTKSSCLMKYLFNFATHCVHICDKNPLFGSSEVCNCVFAYLLPA